MSGFEEHLLWPDPLEALVHELDHVHQITVLAETESTQDALVRLGPSPGAVLVAGRQTAGRGRLGRSWADDEGAGIALSLAVRMESPALLCARGAIALSSAFTPLLAEQGHVAGVKWPNDLVVLAPGPRKLAGVLVEQAGDHVVVGIGVNIHARDWPDELAGTASSLAEVGVSIERLDAMMRLLRAWDRAAGLSESELSVAFTEADVLVGRVVIFEESGVLHEGVVESADPFSGVRLRTSGGVVQMRPDLARFHAWT